LKKNLIPQHGKTRSEEGKKKDSMLASREAHPKKTVKETIPEKNDKAR